MNSTLRGAEGYPLPPLSELSTTGFVLARVAGGDSRTALHLVGQAQRRLLRDGPGSGDPRLHFLRLLESTLQDWLRRSPASAWFDHHWQRLTGSGAVADALSDPLEEHPATQRLRRLPFLRQQAAVLQRLENLSPQQSAEVLGCRTALVTHPLYPARSADAPMTARQLRAYRRRLRALYRAIDELPDQVPAPIRYHLQESLSAARKDRLPPERQVFSLWQQALERSLMPTGIALLCLLLAFLLALLLLL